MPEQDIRDFFPPEQPPGERSFQRGVNGIFRAIGGRIFGSSAPGRKPGGAFRSERKISRTGRPGVSVSGFRIFPRFRRSGQAGGPTPWPAGFQYRLPRKGQVNRGLEGWEARPERPFAAGAFRAAKSRGQTRRDCPFSCSSANPKWTGKKAKKFGPMIRISAHGSKIYSR
nr:hypothetical protein [Bacillaceae bacterium]